MPNNSSPHFVSPGRNITDNIPVVALTIPGSPIVHYDFTDISTLWQDTSRTNAITADGQDILGVTDLGSLGRHLQPIVANGPRYTAVGINSLAAADFDRLNAESLTPTVNVDLDNDYTYMVVAELDDVGAAPTPGFALEWLGNNNFLTVTGSNDPETSAFARGGVISQSRFAGGNFAAYGGGTDTGTNWFVSVNTEAGEATTAQANIPLAAAFFGIGGRQTGGNLWHGFISEIAIWDNRATIATNLQIRDYVTTKYGLTWA